MPTATSFRTIAVTTLDARRRQLKEAGRARLVHAPDRLRDRARRRPSSRRWPITSRRSTASPRGCATAACKLGLAVDVERKDGSRTLMVPVIRNAGSLRFDDFLAAYDALVEKARTNTLVADDLAGANVTLTNPGGLGTSASVPRLMPGQGTIVATGSIAYPPGLEAIGAQIGAEKVMTLTSTYDHRVIQGAESGPLPGPRRGTARRRRRLLRGRLRRARRDRRARARRPAAAPPPPAPPPRPPAPRARSSCRRPRPPTRSCARCAPTATWPRRSTRSARPRRATRRSIPPRSA